MAQGAPPLDTVLTDMLGQLVPLLPESPLGVPPSSVSVASAKEKSLAIGNLRGTQKRAGFPVVEMKGGRLDAAVQFQLWGTQPQEVDSAIDTLQGNLLATSESLHSAGFLSVNGEGSLPAEHIPSESAWRRTTEYRFLYEFHYDDDAAESLLARIPLEADLEQRDSPERETTTVTNAMQRWDDERAEILSVVSHSGAVKRVSGISALAYLPGVWVGTSVEIERLTKDAVDAPTVYATLDAFVTAITDPDTPDRHARVVLPTVAAFLAALDPGGSNIELGDWERATPDVYEPRQREFVSPLVLDAPGDVFQIVYPAAPFDDNAVVYLRARSGGFQFS